MSEKPFSPLRQRMLEEMSVRRFHPIRNASTSVPSRGLPPSWMEPGTLQLQKSCGRSNCT